MRRHLFHPILIVLTAIATLAALGTAARAQVDREWLRMWTAVQSHKPPALQVSGRIAPAGEPGTPLVIHGRVIAPDGHQPVAGAVVFAYQTDRDGLYDLTGRPGQPWRLRGWVVTDAEGRFEFRTIRPGSYPGRQIPAHVHLTVDTPQYGRQWSQEMHFDDDRLVKAEERRASAALAPFGGVTAVRTIDGVEHVDFNIRLKPRGDF